MGGFFFFLCYCLYFPRALKWANKLIAIVKKIFSTCCFWALKKL